MHHGLARRAIASLSSLGLALGAFLALASGTASAASPGITSNTITIGWVGDLTGAGASSFADGAKGVDARFKLQNAHGGVDGRKLVLKVVDAQSSATSVLTATQLLVQQDNVFGVIPESIVFAAAYRYLNQQGVPVTGNPFDGAEWGDTTINNMFAFTGAYSPHFPALSTWGTLLKDAGVTNFGVIGGSSGNSLLGAKSLAAAAKAAGITVGFEDLAVPNGATNLSSDAIAMKAAGVNGVMSTTVASTALGLLTALQQNGVKATPLLQSVYGTTSLTNPAVTSAIEGGYLENGAAPFEENIPATQAAAGALKKYEGITGDWDAGSSIGYVAADLMIKGLQVAGKNPTRQSFITNLHKVKDYNAGGLLPGPVNLAQKLQGTYGGPSAIGNCLWVLKVVGSKYVPYPSPGKSICGHVIPGTDVA
jgi:branched-chain amino acid transport system substrate-binding protein